jgi:uncharacterized membrane protein
MGTTRIVLEMGKGNASGLTDLWQPMPQFFKYWGASILYGIAVMFGIFLLVIPGIYLAIRLQFFGYFIVDKHQGPMEALKSSFTITHGIFWQLFTFGLVLAGINIIGFFCLLLGLFVSIPVTGLAVALVYLLLGRADTTTVNPSGQ